MKKALILATLLVAGATQAATLTWGWKSSAAVKFDTTALGSAGTAYLLFIGNDSVNDYTFAQYVAMASDDTSDQYVTSAATKVGKINVAAVQTQDTPGNFVSVLSFVSEGKTYWNVSSSVYELTAANIKALDEEGTALPDSSFAFSSSVSSGSGSVGGGWAQVPEPSTAALALAGLALLLKRRKA